MSQEKPNPQPSQPPSNSKQEASYSPDDEPLLGQTIKSSANSSATPSVLEKFQSFWNSALVKIRSFLPENLASKLSDRALTGIFVAIALIFVGVSVSTFSEKPKEVATVSPQTEAPESNSILQAESVKSTTPVKQQSAQSSLPTEQNKLVSKDTIKSGNIENLAVKETSKPPSPLSQDKTSSKSDKKRIIKTKQQQNRVLTPEQTLIAIVENQITEVTNSLSKDSEDEAFLSNLINSVQADFASSTLTLKISDDWYSLKKAQQNKLAADILERSKELDFIHLEITDSKNKLIARNPVIGNEMIIFKR